MEPNKYIAVFKNKILTKVKSDSQDKKITPEYFEGLFSEIKADIRRVFDLLGYQSVDENTFQNYYEVAKKEYLSTHPITIETANSLTKKGFTSWLTSERNKETDWDYTERYLSYLENNGRAEAVVNETESSSLEIMEKLGDPKSSDAFYVKGLVVGEVQSGKTGNFNAVINRAIDSGYGLVIVLSGIMEDLRSQTQERIESDVIGEGINIETKTLGTKGVGKDNAFGLRGGSTVEQIMSITSSKSDFNKPLADANSSLNHTNVLVCKKNISILRNLIIWLHDSLEQHKDKHSIPLLVLDDEADNASLNNVGSKGREYASKVNGHIRALLHLFHKKTYIGYTASPFANVLQDRNLEPETNWPIKYKLDGEDVEKNLPQVPNIFPDDFLFIGGKESVRKQIGMAVPPEGIKVIFKAILNSFAGNDYSHKKANIKVD